MGNLVWVTIFFPRPLELEIFSLTYNGVGFFSALYVMSDIFFSAGYYFSQVFLCKPFPPRNHVPR